MPYPIACLGRLQVVSRCYFWKLVVLRPLSDRIKVPAFMNRVEVDEGLERCFRRLIPDLTEHTYIDSTHQLLANDIETVGYSKYKLSP